MGGRGKISPSFFILKIIFMNQSEKVTDSQEPENENKALEQQAPIEEQTPIEEQAPTVKITSEEISVISDADLNFRHAHGSFEKGQAVNMTRSVFEELCKIPNFKRLLDSGVIKIG